MCCHDIPFIPCHHIGQCGKNKWFCLVAHFLLITMVTGIICLRIILFYCFTCAHSLIFTVLFQQYPDLYPKGPQLHELKYHEHCAKCIMISLLIYEDIV